MIIRFAIAVLSGVGLWDALYFTFAYYGRVKKARWVPAILCARDGSNCVTVVQTRYARLLWVPNSLLGVVYYLLLIFWATAGQSVALVLPAGMREYTLSLSGLLIAASVAAVAMGFYLIYSLLKKLHTHCPLCYTAHAINLTILVLLLLAK
jgi:uncharacterized membrane protein